MTEEPMTLSSLRTAQGLSLLEVGRRMGVTKPRVGQIERDFPNVRFSVVRAYIEAVGGAVSFVGLGGSSVLADQIQQDPRGPRNHGNRTKVRADNN